MLGRMVEIGVGQHGTLDEVGAKGGLVPKNPFASLAESKFAHANPEKFGGEKGLDEWDKSTDFSKIPNKVKKAKK
jgi:hypothetical protein